MENICMWCINEEHMYVMPTWTVYAWNNYMYERNGKKHGYAMNAWKICVYEKYVICIYIWI